MRRRLLAILTVVAACTAVLLGQLPAFAIDPGGHAGTSHRERYLVFRARVALRRLRAAAVGPGHRRTSSR